MGESYSQTAFEDQHTLENAETLTFDDYKNAAYEARENHDDGALSRALTEMYHSSKTIAEVQKIKDYMRFHGGYFETMLDRKIEELKQQREEPVVHTTEAA